MGFFRHFFGSIAWLLVGGTVFVLGFIFTGSSNFKVRSFRATVPGHRLKTVFQPDLFSIHPLIIGRAASGLEQVDPLSDLSCIKDPCLTFIARHKTGHFGRSCDVSNMTYLLFNSP